MLVQCAQTIKFWINIYFDLWERVLKNEKPFSTLMSLRYLSSTIIIIIINHYYYHYYHHHDYNYHHYHYY